MEIVRVFVFHPIKFVLSISANADNLLFDFFLPDKYLKVAKGSVSGNLVDHVKNKPTDKKDDADAALKIDNLFKTINQSLSPEVVQSTQAIYSFKVKGKSSDSPIMP